MRESVRIKPEKERHDRRKQLHPTEKGAATKSIKELCETIRKAAAAVDNADLEVTKLERVRTLAYQRLGSHLLALRKAIPGGWRKKGEGLVGRSKFQRAVDIACYLGKKQPDKGFTTTLTDLLDLIAQDKNENPSKYPWQQKKKPERAKAAAGDHDEEIESQSGNLEVDADDQDEQDAGGLDANGHDQQHQRQRDDLKDRYGVDYYCFATPSWLRATIEREYGYPALDVAASHDMQFGKRFYAPEQDGMKQNWYPG